MGRASKIMAPTSCLTGQLNRLPDAPSAYEAMITRPMAAPAQSLYVRRRREIYGRTGRSQQ